MAPGCPSPSADGMASVSGARETQNQTWDMGVRTHEDTMGNLSGAEVTRFGVAAAACEGLHEVFKGEIAGSHHNPSAVLRATSLLQQKHLFLTGLRRPPRRLPHSGKTPQTSGCSPSPSPKQSSAVDDLHVSGWTGASELGLLVPSPSKMDLSRFSFSAKEHDPVTARRAPPRKLSGSRDGATAGMGHQVPSARAAQALGTFYNFMECENKISTVAGPRSTTDKPQVLHTLPARKDHSQNLAGFTQLLRESSKMP